MITSRVIAASALIGLGLVVLLLAGPHAGTGLIRLNLLGTELVQRLDDGTHVKLNSGYYLPLLGWGSSGNTGEIATAAVQAAVYAGYRHIDAAEMYGNEEALGKGLQMLYATGNVRRQDLFLVSKVGNNHHSAEEVLKAAQNTLANLQEDYIDLYHLHWPNSEVAGPKVQPPFNETWAAMEDLVDMKLVRSIGLSNFSPEKVQEVLKNARIRPAVNQVEVHPNFRNERVIEWCQKEGIHVTAYAPLSSPGTMGSMGKKVPNLLKDEEVGDIAKKNGKTPAQVLLRWGLQHGTSVIPKSGNVRHIKENLKDIWGWTLPQKDFETLSSRKYQEKYFDGNFVLNPKGPYHNYEELWDEPKP